jgi:hypothetical protein
LSAALEGRAHRLPACRIMPPSMTNVLPVTYEAASEAR